MNEFEKIYNKIVEEMIVDLHENLKQIHVIEEHAIVNHGKIYTGGLIPERKLDVESNTVN